MTSSKNAKMVGAIAVVASVVVMGMSAGILATPSWWAGIVRPVQADTEYESLQSAIQAVYTQYQEDGKSGEDGLQATVTQTLEGGQVLECSLVRINKKDGTSGSEIYALVHGHIKDGDTFLEMDDAYRQFSQLITEALTNVPGVDKATYYYYVDNVEKTNGNISVSFHNYESVKEAIAAMEADSSQTMATVGEVTINRASNGDYYIGETSFESALETAYNTKDESYANKIRIKTSDEWTEEEDEEEVNWKLTVMDMHWLNGTEVTVWAGIAKNGTTLNYDNGLAKLMGRLQTLLDANTNDGIQSINLVYTMDGDNQLGDPQTITKEATSAYPKADDMAGAYELMYGDESDLKSIVQIGNEGYLVQSTLANPFSPVLVVKADKTIADLLKLETQQYQYIVDELLVKYPGLASTGVNIVGITINDDADVDAALTEINTATIDELMLSKMITAGQRLPSMIAEMGMVLQTKLDGAYSYTDMMEFVELLDVILEEGQEYILVTDNWSVSTRLTDTGVYLRMVYGIDDEYENETDLEDQLERFAQLNDKESTVMTVMSYDEDGEPNKMFGLLLQGREDCENCLVDTSMYAGKTILVPVSNDTEEVITAVKALSSTPDELVVLMDSGIDIGDLIGAADVSIAVAPSLVTPAYAVTVNSTYAIEYTSGVPSAVGIPDEYAISDTTKSLVTEILTEYPDITSLDMKYISSTVQDNDGVLVDLRSAGDSDAGLVATIKAVITGVAEWTDMPAALQSVSFKGADFQVTTENGKVTSVTFPAGTTKEQVAAAVRTDGWNFKSMVLDENDNVATEYEVVNGYIDSEDPTPSPTPSPTPTPTPAPSQSSGSGSAAGTSDPNDRHASGKNVPNDAKPQGCGDTAPSGQADLFQIDRKGTEATLYFAPIPGANSYHVVFGHSEGDERYGGVSMSADDVSGVLAIDISNLTPGQQYAFKIAPVNGCATGEWSNWLTAKSISAYGNTKIKTYRYN